MRRRTTTSHAAPARPRRRFLLALVGIGLLAAGVRVTYVVSVTRHDPLRGDAQYYSAMANTLARGDGFRDPFRQDRTVPSADHPPLTAIVAAPASWIAGTGADAATRHRRETAQRLTMALIGALAVVAIGFAARHLVPSDADRVGLLAGLGAALHPGLWINDGLVMSESVGALTIALVIWVSLVVARQPTGWSMLALGATTGLAIMARAESALLVIVLVIPLALTRRGDPDRRPPLGPVRWLAAGTLGVTLVIAPWVGSNLVRFNHPVTLSTNDGLTLVGTNCDPAWRGPGRGLWVLQCIEAVDSNGDGTNDWQAYLQGVSATDPGQDPSDVAVKYRAAAADYLRGHAGGLPEIMVVRVARVMGVYGVRQMTDFYNLGEGRPRTASWLAAIGWWAIALVGSAGLVVLWRRRMPVWPLLAHVIAVTGVAAAFYGLWRFRIGAEIAMLMASAIAVDALLGRMSRRRSLGDEPVTVFVTEVDAPRSQPAALAD